MYLPMAAVTLTLTWWGLRATLAPLKMPPGARRRVILGYAAAFVAWLCLFALEGFEGTQALEHGPRLRIRRYRFSRRPWNWSFCRWCWTAT